MSWIIKFLALVVVLAGFCMAQDSPVTVVNKKNDKVSLAEVNKLYVSALSAVQREFTAKSERAPALKLVVGADIDNVDLDHKTISLTKWNRTLFTQGAVMIAFEDLLTLEKRLEITTRAVKLADATIDIAQFSK